MSWFLRTFTGLVIALLILGVGGYFAIQYVFTQLTAAPPKPTFPNDNPNYGKKVDDGKKVATKAVPPTAAPEPPKNLPTGAYKGIVKQPIGLIVRGAASSTAGQIDGVDYNQPVIVLSKSQDGIWEKIRYSSNNQEGWVKAGNIQKAEP
jgi:hypothetical protein